MPSHPPPAGSLILLSSLTITNLLYPKHLSAGLSSSQEFCAHSYLHASAHSLTPSVSSITCTHISSEVIYTIISKLSTFRRFVWSFLAVPCLVIQSCLTLWPHGVQPARLLTTGILQARMLEWVASPPPGGSSWPRDWTQVSLIAGGFFPFMKDCGNHKILEMYWQLQVFFFFFIFILNYLRTSHVTYLFSISRYLWVLCKHLITAPWSLAHCNIRWRYNVTTLLAISFWVNDWIVE